MVCTATIGKTNTKVGLCYKLTKIIVTLATEIRDTLVATIATLAQQTSAAPHPMEEADTILMTTAGVSGGLTTAMVLGLEEVSESIKLFQIQLIPKL